MALLMRPAILLVRRLESIPRVLADDILLYALGRGAPRKVVPTIKLIMAYLRVLGVIISLGDDKTHLFALAPRDRKALARVTWTDHEGKPFQLGVKFAWRDLGAHTDTTK